METQCLSKELFNEILKEINFYKSDETDFLYDLYETVIDTINQVTELAKEYKFNEINHSSVILYLVNEYKFTTALMTEDEKVKLFDDESYFEKIGSFIADKYLTNEQLNFQDQAFLNKFTPPISTLELYLNFSLRILENLNVIDRNQILLKDLLLKAFKMGKCIIELLNKGFETEAFSTRRTLHENECLVIVLVKNGARIFEEYFKHIRYNLAFRHQINSVEETDKIFESIKSEMKKHDLRSKDMKKFIEYGYLYKVKNIEEYQNLKLNFRDGVEKVAGLSQYSKVYEMASEIAHSSPLLFYSNRQYFFEITIINLYETFFRLENIFDLYLKQIVSKEEYSNFQEVKKLYINQLHSIHKIFVDRLISQNNVSKIQNS